MSTSAEPTATSGKIWVALDDRAIIRVGGPDARDFLQNLVSSDLTKVGPDRAIHAALLTPQGKFLHEFFIAQADGAFLLDCGRQRRDDLIRRLTMYKLRAQVEIADAADDYAVFALLGERAIEGKEGTAAALGSGIVFVDPRLAALGARAILPAANATAILAAADFSEAGLDTYEDHRVTLGVPDGGRDLVVEKSFLLENNFEELNGVDFEKGCYVGQEVTARTKHRGLVKKRMLPVQASGPLPGSGTKITLDGKDAGVMFSSVGTRGLALLRLERVEEAARAGTELSSDGTKLRATVPDWLTLPETQISRA